MINFSKTKFTSKSASNINYINDSENIYTRFTKIAPSNISGLFFTLITGFMFHALLQATTIYLIFLILRNLSSNFTLPSNFKCNLLVEAVIVFVLLFSKAAAVTNITISIITFLFLPSVSLFMWLASINKNRVHAFFIVLSVIIYVVSILLYLSHNLFGAAYVVTTLFAVSVIYMTLIFMNKEKTHIDF